MEDKNKFPYHKNLPTYNFISNDNLKIRPFGIPLVDDPILKNEKSLDIWFNPIFPKEVEFSGEVTRIMKTFNFKEACRRVICGNLHIRRENWKPNDEILVFKVNDAMFLISKSNSLTYLTDADIQANDWIDPGE